VAVGCGGAASPLLDPELGIYPYRVRFSKTGKLRFLSHHDLLRAIERALRRTGLPIRMTEGYNPHPILAFPTALGVGIESLDEIFEIELSEEVPPERVRETLAAQFPEGIGIRSAERFERKDRTRVEFVEYEAECPGQRAEIERFLGLAECPVERSSDKGTKTVDIRPYVLTVTQEGDRVTFRVRVTDSGSARPDEVLRALGIRDARVRKTRMELAKRDG
jgi:radical SAM-linked protein